SLDELQQSLNIKIAQIKYDLEFNPKNVGSSDKKEAVKDEEADKSRYALYDTLMKGDLDDGIRVVSDEKDKYIISVLNKDKENKGRICFVYRIGTNDFFYFSNKINFVDANEKNI